VNQLVDDISEYVGSIALRADNDTLETAISLIIKTFHRLDAVVLNAGTFEPFERISDGKNLTAWKKAFDINVFSLVQVLQLVTKPLTESERTGRVVFVSSGAAIGNTTGWGAYSASKAAMNSLCRTYANEQPDVICVALRPGMVATEMQAALRERGSQVMKASEFSRFTDAHSTGALLDPELPGYVIASLALNASRELTGSFVSWNSEECKPYRKDI